MVKMQDAVVLFIDLIDSTQLGNTLPARQYQEVLDQFRKTCCDVVDDFMHANFREESFSRAFFRVQGDEFLAFFTEGEIYERAIDAVGIAHNIKLSWLLSPYNWMRLGEEKRPVELAAGIHRGPVVFEQRRQPNTQELDGSFEGYSISIAKRVETHSRIGLHSKILVTEPIHRELEGRPQIASFVYSGLADFKGISQKYATWELVSHTEYFAAEELGEPHQGQPRQALSRIRAVAKAEPENLWLNSILLAAEFGAKNWHNVIYEADGLLKKYNDLYQPRKWKVESLKALEEWEEVFEEVEQLAIYSPNPHHFDKALCLIKLRQFKQAQFEVVALQRQIGRGEYSVPRYLKSAILVRTGKAKLAMRKLLDGFDSKSHPDDKFSLSRYLISDPVQIMSELSTVKGYDKLQNLVKDNDR